MVRNANETDISFILNELCNFNLKKPSKDIINHPFNKFLICEFDNIKVGFMQYSLYYDRIEIDYIFVDENYRRKGLADGLLNFLLSLYKGNINNITLEVSIKNIPALNLYKKHGFEVVATRDNYYGHGNSALLMIRRF